jgi:hypothetical protein
LGVGTMLEAKIIDRGRGPEVERTRITVYDVLGLPQTGVVADVYGALAYYHRHKDELDAYLQDRAKDSVLTQQEIEAAQSTFDQIKSRILARRIGADASAAV